MKLFVVSLVRSVSRRQALLGTDFAGVRYEFFDAFDGSLGEHQSISRYDAAATLAHFGLPLTAGEVACYASHYTLWEYCKKVGQPIAIMEDDVTVSEHFGGALAMAGENVSTHRFIRLAGLQDRPFRVLRRLNARFRLVRFKQGPSGTQCYCISPEGAEALIARAQRWIEPVDVYIDSFWRHGVTPKAIIPFEAHELDRNFVDSTIGDRRMHRVGWMKLRHEIGRVRQKMARLAFNALHPTD